jgi:hypothetical protein
MDITSIILTVGITLCALGLVEYLLDDKLKLVANGTKYKPSELLEKATPYIVILTKKTSNLLVDMAVGYGYLHNMIRVYVLKQETVVVKNEHTE